MTVKSLDDLDRIDVLCEVLADAFVDSSGQEIDSAITEVGLNPDAFAADISRTIDNALNKSLKKKLQEAGQLARLNMSARRPDLTNLTREQLVEQLRQITANEDNAGEMLTIAARAGRGSMSVEELRSLIEDFQAVTKPQTQND